MKNMLVYFLFLSHICILILNDNKRLINYQFYHETYLFIFHFQTFLSKDYFDVAIRLLSSRKPIDSMTSVYLMKFLQKKSTIESLRDSTVESSKKLYTSTKTLSMYLVESVASEFHVHCRSAKQNLLLASLKTPVYGPLSAIHELIIHSIEE